MTKVNSGLKGLTQKVLKGYFPYSEKGSTYIPGMYVEPFSISLYEKEP